jgi:hypothetical protein
VLALALGLFIASQNAAAQTPPRRDTRAWYQAYADGVRALQQGRWQEAIDSLEASKRAGAPKPGRKVPSYGDNFVDFLPDYYLGVAYTNLKQYVQADRAFAAVRASGLIGPRDREYGEFEKQATVASAEVNRAPAVTGAPIPSGAANASAANAANAPPSTPNPAIQQTPPPQNAATTAVQQAPPQTNPLSNAGPPATAVTGAPAAAASKAPGNTVTPRPAPIQQNRPVPPGQVAAANEQAAIVAYLSGNYDQVPLLLGRAVTANAATPRAYFYLACSHTVLAILGGGDANSLTDARAMLARAGDPAQFAEDRRYISPRVLQMLGLNQ